MIDYSAAQIDYILAERDQLKAELERERDHATSIFKDRETIKAELERVKASHQFTREWYSSRIERLSVFIREEISEPQRTRYFSIIANGDADPCEDYGYERQLVIRNHEIERLKAQLAALEKDRARLLMLDRPWDLRSCVSKLTEAAHILLRDLDYDGHGHELIREAYKAAEEWLHNAAMQKEGATICARAPDPTCPNCRGTGYYGDNGPGRKGNREYHVCECINRTEKKEGAWTTTKNEANTSRQY